jgi:hypothetical protein
MSASTQPYSDSTIVQEWRAVHVRIALRADNIVEYDVDANAYVTLEDQMAISRTIHQRLGNIKRYALIVDTGDFTTHSPESTRYARSVEEQDPFLCIAILAEGLARRLAFNVYVRIFRPNVPMRAFERREEAEAWCLQNLAASHSGA